MKQLTQKAISLLLSLVMLFSLSSTALAVSSPNDLTSSDEIALSREIYASLTPDAREIFDASLRYDAELLQYHTTYVDPSFTISSSPVLYSAAVADPLSVLSTQLSYIPLPTAVLYSLKAMGASMIAAIADGPLPIGDILLGLV